MPEPDRTSPDLADAASLWRTLVEHIPAVTYVADATPEATLRYVSPQVERLLGHPAEAFLADDDLWYRSMHPDDVDRVRAAERSSAVEERDFECEYRMVHADGRVREVWERDARIVAADGTVSWVQGIVVDLTELRSTEAELRSERDRAARYLDLAGTTIVVLDGRGRITLVNRAGHELLGHAEGELEGLDWFERFVAEEQRAAGREQHAKLLADEAEASAFESEVVVRDGSTRTMAWRATVLRDDDGTATGSMNAGLDVTERRAAEEQIAFLAYHDPLTGLPNRALLAEHLELSLARARREERSVALLYLDLDDFKLVNDSLGHAAGDRLLTKVALRLQARRRDTDLLARQGGDEFLLLLSDLDPETAVDDAVAAAEGLVENLQTPFVVAGAEFNTGASVGISVLGVDAHDGEALMRHADAAMYQAKADGQNEVRLYDGSRSEPLRRLSMTSRLRQAMTDDQLVLHWQPIVAPATGELWALEALVRWEDPVRGLVLPGEFVPFAEESGLIERLGEHVVELACAQRRRWQDAGFEPRITLNLSPRELRREGLVDQIGTTIAEHGLDPSCVTLEITESAAMQDPERTGPALLRAAETGIRVAIDDFGAGYSSLARLIALPVHWLKIDRSFLAAAPTDPAAAAVLTAVVQLSQSLGMEAVAEGVETEAQRELLVDLDCPLAQGYLLGRPLPADELVVALAHRPAA
jgi:diguanylate cyclase (GGDEF)-like protein/PAS domain S-box-containing protein